MKKKILVLAVFVIMALSMLCGCEKKHGEFYTLQEAYDSGLLTKDDLEQIAYYTNNDLINPETLSVSIEIKIKNDTAYDIRHNEVNPIKEAEPDGVEIFVYYGEYSGGYAVRIRSRYWLFATDVPFNWVEIGGVKILIVGYEPFYIWKEN